MSVPRQVSERSFMYVLGASIILPLSTLIFLLEFRTLSTMSQCGILCFSIRYFNVKLCIVFNEFVTVLGTSIFKIFKKYMIM